jgi:adenosylcobalamin-dependent ribonucleoside-triphosphate reductase
MKAPGFWEANPQRAQSNNSIAFYEKPARRQIRDLFEMMVDHGGAEPGFLNAEAARWRAPWFKLPNPCGEVLLPTHGFCNLVDINVNRFSGDHIGLHRALWIMARANYRQTVVELRDGLLQDAWHQQNEYLRLCGVGLTGLACRPDLAPHDYRMMRNTAVAGAYSMADELGLERPKNVTLVKPSGTLAKVMDCTEGAHKPLGRYILNNVQFGRHDPTLPALIDAGYRVADHPTDSDGVLVTLPQAWDSVPFDDAGGVPVNLEPAVVQLERYRTLMDWWCDQNVSVTVSYDPSEVPALVQWFDKHWDSYVGVSFLFRNDPTKTAKDLGFAYLPQSVVSKEDYDAYCAGLRPLDLDEAAGQEYDLDADCPAGGCPIR